jgi:hypothetical protein
MGKVDGPQLVQQIRNQLGAQQPKREHA